MNPKATDAGADSLPMQAQHAQTSRRRGVAFVLAAALAMSSMGWLPGARGNPTPPTVSRVIEIQPGSLVAEARGALSLSNRERIRSNGPARTTPSTVCAPIQFTAVGLEWRQTAGGTIHAAIKSGGSRGQLGSSTVVDSDGGEGPDVGSPEYHPEHRSTALLWTGGARCIEFSLKLPDGVSMSGLRAVFINTSGTAEGGGAADAGAALSPLESLFGASPANAMTTRPRLVARAEWGADESLRNCDPAYAPRLKMAFVHHTAGSNDYSRSESDDIVRSIYWYHTQVKGWCDIAYNFLVDRYGTVFVGRYGGEKRPTIPAATQGFNTGSTAIAAMGNYMDARPASATVDAIERVLAWRLDVAHLPASRWARMTSAGGPNTRYSKGTKVWLKLISGHRATGYTDCPGDHLNRLLPEIRRATSALGRPKILRPRRSTSSITFGGADKVRFTARASNTLAWTLDIRSSGGVVVRRYARIGAELDVRWDGTDDLGLPVPPGEYAVVIRGSTATGATARRARLRVEVTEP